MVRARRYRRPSGSPGCRPAGVPIVALVGRVIFMCGPAGSGKSTVARQYEQQGMTRLSFDQEAWSRGITAMPLPPGVHRDIEYALRPALGRVGKRRILLFVSRFLDDTGPALPVRCAAKRVTSCRAIPEPGQCS